jgi:biotin carboxylase
MVSRGDSPRLMDHAVFQRRGHASEKPELPTALAETPSEIRFLGPGAAAMAALGDKIGSTILAQAADVPTIPWSGTGVKVDFDSCNGEIPPEIYDTVGPCRILAVSTSIFRKIWMYA